MKDPKSEKEEPRPDYSCRCPALDHDHKWGDQCKRTATYAGGVCHECRYWHTYPREGQG